MKKSYLIFVFILIGGITLGQKKKVHLSDDEKSIYALAIRGSAVPCHYKLADLSHANLKPFEKYRQMLSTDKKNNYLLADGNFAYLNDYKVTDTITRAHFKLKKLKPYLSGRNTFSDNCDLFLFFSPIIYSQDRKRAFLISSESTKREFLSESMWFMKKKEGVWHIVKQYVPFLY